MTRATHHGLWTHQLESFHEFESDELINPHLQAAPWRSFIPARQLEFDWRLGLEVYAQTLLDPAIAARSSWPWSDRPWQQLFWSARPSRELGRFWSLAQSAPERLSDTQALHPGLERLARAVDDPWPSLDALLERHKRFFALASSTLGERFRWFMFAPLVDPLSLGLTAGQVLSLIGQLIPEDERAPFFERVELSADPATLEAALHEFERLSLSSEGSLSAAYQLVRAKLPSARAALVQALAGEAIQCSPALRRAIIDRCLEGEAWSQAVAHESYPLSPDLAPWLLARLAPSSISSIMSRLMAQPQELMAWISSLMRVHSPHAVRGFMTLSLGPYGPSSRAARSWLMSEGANVIAVCYELLASDDPAEEVLKPLAQELLTEYSARGHEALVDAFAAQGAR